MTKEEARAFRAKIEHAFGKAAPNMSADEVIHFRELAPAWTKGAHAIGKVCQVGGSPWMCIQAHDTSIYPDIVPGGTAWATFWAPYHGTTPETALELVAPTGAHDIYKTGEYMIWTDGGLYRCLQDTAYSPADYAEAWALETPEFFGGGGN